MFEWFAGLGIMEKWAVVTPMLVLATVLAIAFGRHGRRLARADRAVRRALRATSAAGGGPVNHDVRGAVDLDLANLGISFYYADDATLRTAHESGAVARLRAAVEAELRRAGMIPPTTAWGFHSRESIEREGWEAYR